MTRAIIIPYRGTISDKSRLQSKLGLEVIEKLLSKVTQNVINEASKTKGIDQIYVLTHKPELEYQGNYNILKDRGEELNDSVLKALDDIEQEIVAIVMADLPLITSNYIEEIFDDYFKTNIVVLAPTEDAGTSIICFNKTSAFPGLFGKNSSLRFKDYFDDNSKGIIIKKYKEAYRDIDTFKDLIKISNNELLPNELHSIFKECVEFEREN